MEPIADLPTLQTILQGLQKRGMVVYLTPPGVRRGVIVTHGFFTPEALERERAKHAHAIASADADDPPAASTGAAAGSHRSALAEKVERLESELERQGAEIRELAEQVRSFKNALGD
jgi:hypothetical protein